jgi:hypothetical protein
MTTELISVDDLQTAELAVAEQPEIVVPLTGELVDLRQPGQVAAALESVREAKRHLDQARVLLETVLRLEASRQGTKTLHLGGVDCVVSGGSRVEYDCEQLRELLAEAGLPDDRLAELIVETVSYRVNQTVAKSVSAANPRYRAAIERCRRVEPAPWRVTVKHR